MGPPQVCPKSKVGLSLGRALVFSLLAQWMPNLFVGQTGGQSGAENAEVLNTDVRQRAPNCVIWWRYPICDSNRESQITSEWRQCKSSDERFSLMHRIGVVIPPVILNRGSNHKSCDSDLRFEPVLTTIRRHACDWGSGISNYSVWRFAICDSAHLACAPTSQGSEVRHLCKIMSSLWLISSGMRAHHQLVWRCDGMRFPSVWDT